MKKIVYSVFVFVVLLGSFSVVSYVHAQADVSDGCTLIVNNLEVGSKGAEVFALETFLQKEGYFKQKPNTVFNKATATALTAFQLKAGVIARAESDAAGRTGGPTRDAIANASCKKKDLQGAGSCVYITRNLTRENNGPVFEKEIRELQRLLVNRNYLDATDVTGFFGPVTRQAVVQFQLDNKLITSRTSEAAGVVGPAVRTFIQNSTCGDARITTTATNTVTSFTAAVSASTNVQVNDILGQHVMWLKLTPKQNNAELRNIILTVESDDEDVTPASRIEYIDVYLKGSGIVSRNRATVANWNKVDDGVYNIVLDGDTTELTAREENEFSIRVVPKRSLLAAERVKFSAHIPTNGARIQFANVNDQSTGVQMWGAPSTKATFYLGRATTADDDDADENENDDSTENDTTGDEEEDTAPAPVAEPVVRAPVLQSIAPTTGSFGEYITLTGRNFAATGNDIVIRHPQSNSETVLRNFASRNGKIIINFPGRAREFVRPNGTKVTNKTGNYQIRVVSNDKTSNVQVFKVQ